MKNEHIQRLDDLTNRIGVKADQIIHQVAIIDEHALNEIVEYLKVTCPRAISVEQAKFQIEGVGVLLSIVKDLARSIAKAADDLEAVSVALS